VNKTQREREIVGFSKKERERENVKECVREREGERERAVRVKKYSRKNDRIMVTVTRLRQKGEKTF
jgi:hypothetical protein